MRKYETISQRSASLVFTLIYVASVVANSSLMSGAHKPIQVHHLRDASEQADGVADAEIVRVLGVALAVGADSELREVLRGLAGASRDAVFAVSQPGKDIWLTVDGSRVVASRQQPAALPTVGQEALRANASGVADALRRAFARTTALADAARLIGALFGPGEVPSRQEFAALVPWLPAIEQVAYKTAASIAVTLDLLRPQLITELRSGAVVSPALLNDCWHRIHATAQLTLLASHFAAVPWLTEMAGQFAWANWTPTFVLLRERTTWLAACAARSAIAFGESVVGKYLDTLGTAEHPFRAFDALFGLTAIALANPHMTKSIATEVGTLQRLLETRGDRRSPHTARAYADAIDLMEGTAEWAGGGAAEIEALGWLPCGPRGLATNLALRTDPAIVTQSDHMLGFIILPTVVATPLSMFNPDQSTHSSVQAMTPEVMSEVFLGAWEPAPQKATVLH